MGQTAEGGSLAVARSPFSAQALSPATIDHYHGGKRAFLCRDVATAAIPPAFVSLGRSKAVRPGAQNPGRIGEWALHLECVLDLLHPDIWWAWRVPPGSVASPEGWISACWMARSGKRFGNPVACPRGGDGPGGFATCVPPQLATHPSTLLGPEETSFCQRTS